ncbi:fluoride efflux transporter CrcB [Nocardioides sp. YIM 152315]|uniref:fluoride efflux transporter CrcB n=1 Tax=Nocardioides sp. YIM 152315 TaxID=3031760 RepID=UPI0023DB60B1|nr:fluoride efflux transporter CrcB [Nocardioides sp. YIM 152315]MDF1605036.1 fluoride efflux transporter CrcB [Nocardioides sp. YIM 152315]
MTDGATGDTPMPRLVAAVAVGGAVGALARWWLSEALPPGADAFPWTTFVINVSGSFALALLPAFAAVRRSRALAVGLGPGVLGGYTTLSTYSEQTRALLDRGETLTAGCYVLGTLAACLVAVAAADHWSTTQQRRAFADEGGDE